jgi:hypothetical protein
MDNQCRSVLLKDSFRGFKVSKVPALVCHWKACADIVCLPQIAIRAREKHPVLVYWGTLGVIFDNPMNCSPYQPAASCDKNGGYPCHVFSPWYPGYRRRKASQIESIAWWSFLKDAWCGDVLAEAVQTIWWSYVSVTGKSPLCLDSALMHTEGVM